MRSTTGQRFSNVVRSHERERRSTTKFDGSVEGSSLRLLAGESLVLGNLVFQDDDAAVYIASPNDPVSREIIGISIASASAGSPADILYRGPMSYVGWNWVPGRPIYAGPNGIVTQTAPVNGYLVEVGVAISSDTMLIDIERFPRKVYVKSLAGTLVAIPYAESGIPYPSIAVLKASGEEVSVAVDYSELSAVISSNVTLENHIAVLT